MVQAQSLNIVLTAEQATALRAAVEGGEYASTDEALADAIRDWAARRALRQPDVLRLRALWEEGLASGTAGELDFKALREEARSRLTSR